MENYPQHIQELIKEAKEISMFSIDYWKLRATYLEKYLDPTYGETERGNCRMLYDILKLRTYSVMQAEGSEVSDELTDEEYRAKNSISSVSGAGIQKL